MFPDRILIRKESLGERFVDDDRRLTSFDVTPVDAAPAKQPHAHRFEVAAGDRTEERDRRDGSRPGQPGPPRLTVLPKQPPASGRHVDAETAVTPGSADSRSSMA